MVGHTHTHMLASNRSIQRVVSDFEVRLPLSTNQTILMEVKINHPRDLCVIWPGCTDVQPVQPVQPGSLNQCESPHHPQCGQVGPAGWRRQLASFCWDVLPLVGQVTMKEVNEIGIPSMGELDRVREDYVVYKQQEMALFQLLTSCQAALFLKSIGETSN